MALKRPGPYVGLSANYADDEKIMAAGEDAELLYVRMLAYAARTPLTEGWISDSVLKARLGILPRDAYDTAGNMTGTVPGTDALSRAERLREVGLLERDGSGWRIVTWLKWNRSIEEMGRERVRDSKRKGVLTSTSPETGREQDRESGREAAQVPGSNDQDQDQDQDQGDARKRATRLPDEFKVTDDLRAWAAKNGFGHLDLDALTEEFFDYWRGKSGKDATKADWPATWRNWVRREIKWTGGKQSATAPQEFRGMPPEPCGTCGAPPEISHYDECPEAS